MTAQAGKQAMLRRALSWLHNRTLRGAWAAWVALREERLEQLAAGKAKNLAAARCNHAHTPSGHFESGTHVRAWAASLLDDHSIGRKVLPRSWCP